MSNRNSTFKHNEHGQGEGLEQHGDNSMSIDDELSVINKETPPPFVAVRDKLPQAMNELRNDFKTFQNTIVETLEGFFVKLDTRQTQLITEFEEMRKSFDFLSNKYDDLNKISDDLRQRVKALETRSADNSEQSKRIAELENKLDTMEQQARQCNAEISNLPEKRGEDLMTLVLSIGDIVKQPVTQQDLVAVHRVPQATPNVSRPKNVIVKFSNRMTRDNFLAAFRMAKGITTNQLNISGTPQKVYINEHLTLKNKKLFRDARAVAKEYDFKYIWIKHGTILARANDTSTVIAVRCSEDLLKIKPKSTK